MKHRLFGIACALVLTAATGALASTASQREYKRGYADCAAGRWDENQHGESYKKGCRAAEDKRNASGTETPAAAEQKPAPFMDASVPGKDKQACVRALQKLARNTKVVVVGAVSSEANNDVTLGLGPQKAKWRCLVKGGKVADVTSLTDEGAL
jgi:hypothetical protein